MNDTREIDKTRYLETRFLERIAHDLRGPAGVVLGALDELEGALGHDAKAHAKLFGIARRSTGKILKVAQKLACAAELASGPSFQLAELRLSVLASKATRAAQLLETRHGITLHADFASVSSSSARDLVRADPEWIEMLLVEIVVNALKHARKQVGVQVEEAADRVAVVVVDDGVTQPKVPLALFEPGEDTRGLGVSLAMADLVARAHGGALEVSTEAGRGTRVKLWLPRAPAEEARRSAGVGHAAMTDGERAR